MHLCVLCGWGSTRRVPTAFASALIDEEPSAVRSIPFGYPARRKVVIRVRRTVESTFACVLIDAD